LKYYHMGFFIIISFVARLYAQIPYNLEILFESIPPMDSLETYGVSLSSAGDVNNDGFDDIIVGSKTVVWVGAADTSEGHAYIYYGGNPMDTTIDVCLSGEHYNDLYAYAVAGLGDINCDGYDDVGVSAVNCLGIDRYGRVYVYYGGDPMDSIPDIILKGTYNNSFGTGIAASDVNGDSWPDIVVGERNWGNLNYIHGRVYIFYGGPLLDTIPDIIINGHNSEALGATVGGGGDLNSDGYDDIVVGADENSESYGGAGKVYIFFGGDPMDTVPDAWVHGEGSLDWLGLFNCDIMRMNNDYDWVITSTPYYLGSADGRGKVYILYGGDPMDTLVDVWMLGATDTSSLGMWCGSAGDINGDGYDDAIAGAPCVYNFVGTGYIWLGGPVIDTIPDAWLRGDSVHIYCGWVVASAGDVNNDGRDEVMFSNYLANWHNQRCWVCAYTGSSVQEFQEPALAGHLIIVPNPCQAYCEVKLHNRREGMSVNAMRMYDISGREVIDCKIARTEQGFRIDMSVLPQGVYFMNIDLGGQGTVTQKVVRVR
jgi:hypothetical protein